MDPTEVALLTAGSALAGVLISAGVQVMAQRLQWRRDDRTRRRTDLRDATIRLVDAATAAHEFISRIGTLHIAGTQRDVAKTMSAGHGEVMRQLVAAMDAYRLTATPELVQAAKRMMLTAQDLLATFDAANAGLPVTEQAWLDGAEKWQLGRGDFVEAVRAELYGKREDRL